MLADNTSNLIRLIQSHRLDLSTEKHLQADIETVLLDAGIVHEREKHLSDKDIPDFLVDGGVVIECKMRGARKMDVYKQLSRYAEYESVRRGGMIVVADRWYPSSKTCSSCGHKLDTLALSVREWACPACGSIHDRDVNAAINLKNLAVSSTVSVCGEEGSGLGRKLKTKPASVKQESSSKATYG